MKHTKKCPECGGTEIYKHKVGSAGPQGPQLLPELTGFFENWPVFDAFVCAKCGYYQLFVGEEWLSRVPEKWERHE